MSSIKRDDGVPEPSGDEVKKSRDFSQTRTRYAQVSYGFRKRRLHKLKKRYWFLGVLMLLLFLVMLLT